MGGGWGSGLGSGKSVRGGWRVSAFLLLLTAWQAVLLPWSPLIFKDAGFSATSVGVLSGGATLSGSVGVVMCLRGLRMSRSGAVRRLLLWLMLATAILLNGSGVGLELRHLSQGGVIPSCVRGWVFLPASPVILQNNVSTPIMSQFPKPVSSQQPHNSSALATTTQPPSNGPIPANLTTTTTTTTPSTTTSTTTTPSTTTSTTTTPSTTTSTTTSTSLVSPAKTSTTPTSPIATPVTTTSIRSTVPPVKNTKKANNEVPVNKYASTEENLPFDEDGVMEVPHSPPVGQTPHEPSRKHHHSNVHKPGISSKNSEQDKNINEPDDNDHLTSQDTSNSEENNDSDENYDTYLKYVDEYENPEESEEKVQVDHEDKLLKQMNYYPGSRSNFHSSFGKLSHSGRNALPEVHKIKTSNALHHEMPAKNAAAFWKSYLKEIPNEAKKLLQNSHHTDLFTTKLRKQNKGSDQKSLPLLSSDSHRPHNLRLPNTKTYRPHYPSHQSEDPSDGKSQYREYNSHRSDSRHDGLLRRSRRDLTKRDSKSHINLVKVVTDEIKPQRNDILKNKQNPLEELKSGPIKVGVAVLLVLGGLAGAGVEAGVAQLWHCYVHGYDESGVSQDVLQRTITHTFHLSTYGNHKTWTGITSGGWAMGAGVVSILACLIGTGGGGYGGLLGVHVSLGMGCLLLLLVLPVPYGSIDPPRTRRPLSLYLDDEVLREGVRRLTFHVWIFINGCLAALSLTFSLWLLQEMTAEGWLVGSQAAAVGVTLVSESLALHTQKRLVTRWGLHGLMGVCGVSLMLHYGMMWSSNNVGVVVVAHAGLGVAMAFLWVAVKHNALLLATVSDQEREAWASWWCWRIGLCVGASVWGVAVSGTGGKVRPLLLLATLVAAILASFLCITAVLSRRNSRTRRRVYHTLDLDIANDEIDEEENSAAEDDWLVKRARKEGLTL